jgi:hypothetical protein
VDEKRPDLKAALRELAAEESADLGPHAGLKRLIAYRQGTLPAAEREALQEHLSLCKRCTERLRELRDFEAAAARGDAAGPEALREEAWESLARQLPVQGSKVRPIAGAGRRETPRPRAPRFVYAAAAGLLLALIGLSLWAAVTVQQDRQRLARLEQQLKDREEALAIAQRSLTEAERQLAVARIRPEPEAGRVHELEAQVAELTSTLEKLRRTPPAPDGHDRLAAAREIDLSVAPRFVLRGQEPASGALQGNGAVNPVRIEKGRFTMALPLGDQPAYGEYRFELLDRAGEVLWTGRRPGKALLGDAGTSVSINGLAPGRYRLRVEGLQPDRTELLGEYLLEVEHQENTH